MACEPHARAEKVAEGSHPLCKYVIYFIHDLHGLLDGVRGPLPGGGPTLGMVGGIKTIVNVLDYYKDQDRFAGYENILVCVGGDMVSEYRSRRLDKSNVDRVWQYLLDQINPDAWVLGNHELDPEYADSLLKMLSCRPETGCTRNLLWSRDEGACPVTHVDCSHLVARIPHWSEHVSNGAPGVVFTGLTVAKADWKAVRKDADREIAYREIADDYRFERKELNWKGVCEQVVTEWGKGPSTSYNLSRAEMSPGLVQAIEEVASGKKDDLSTDERDEIVALVGRKLNAKAAHFSGTLKAVAEDVNVWKKVCTRFVREWNKRPLTPCGLLKAEMGPGLVQAISDVAEDRKGGLSTAEQDQIIALANLKLHTKDFYFSNPDVFPTAGIAKEAQATARKNIDDATMHETVYLNRALLLNPVFSPALACPERWWFHVPKAEDLIKELRQEPKGKNCARCEGDPVHIHIAHFSSDPPATFGAKGPWVPIPGGSNHGLPDVILKAHDHARVPKTGKPGTVPRHPKDPPIPTFEAGRDGEGIGRLALEVFPDRLTCDWRIVPLDEEATAFASSEWATLGLDPVTGRAKSYPVVANKGIPHGSFGGNSYDANEQYRAITLYLRSVADRYDEKGTVVVCPSLVMTNSWVDEANVRIDLFDLGHVFGYREELQVANPVGEGDLVNGILTALGNQELEATGLPPMEAGVTDPEPCTWADASVFWHHKEGTWPEGVKVGRVLCVRHDKKEYLVVGPPLAKEKEEIDRATVRIYPLLQSADTQKPQFYRGRDYCTLKTCEKRRARLSGTGGGEDGCIKACKGTCHVSFPTTLYIDRFLVRRFKGPIKSTPIADGRLMHIVAEYVGNCDRAAGRERDLWKQE